MAQLIPVTLDTPRKLYEHQHTIAAACAPCGRWVSLGFIDFARAGRADILISEISVRCDQCGDRGSIQIRPPQPKIERFGPVDRFGESSR